LRRTARASGDSAQSAVDFKPDENKRAWTFGLPAADIRAFFRSLSASPS
jgi:hypothetical protein